ncbi:hypothetical protein [Jiangella alba]|uniref:Uncharacterized protein n=1 Tax=Jiangella alba TaxID=561176 RepID=A0A1H5J8U5_9ACTN|nr:hypothetical protein [Jiangella alba]SEE48840.1 hypothetical protein SAMN04488561_1486 [Jiangella alba]
MTTRSLAQPDRCARKWCEEAGEHEVHRQYLTAFRTTEGRSIGVNVVQVGDQPQAVELTMLPRRGRDLSIVFQVANAEAIARGMRAGARRAGQ